MRVFQKTVSSLLLIFALAVSAPADAVAQDGDLQGIVLQGQLDPVETFIRTLHSRHLNGSVSAEDIRIYFEIFGGTSPTTLSTVNDWVKAKPLSPYANAAMGLYLQSHAWRMRGGDLARYTWPTALKEFQRSLSMAQQYAERAFDLDPTFVMSSDLLLTNAVAVGNSDPEYIYGILDTVMASTPNRGSLTRAANVFNPRWGGAISHLEDLCAMYGNQAAPDIYSSQKLCVADLVLATKPEIELRKQALQILIDHNWQGFQDRRYDLYADPLRRDWADVNPEDVATYLASKGRSDLQTVQSFYEDLIVNLANPASDRLKSIARKHLADAQARALFDLETEPGNRALVELLFFPSNGDPREGPVPVADKRMTLWAEALRAAPYDGSLWNNAATSVHEFRRDIPKALALSRMIAPLQTNAIAYSNHRPEYLRLTLSNMANKYDGLQTLLPKDDPAARTKLRADLDETLACQVIRVSRLFDIVCDAVPNDHSCRIGSGYIDSIVEKTTEYTAANGLCSLEREGKIADIVFYPVDVDVGTYSHKADVLPVN